MGHHYNDCLWQMKKKIALVSISRDLKKFVAPNWQTLQFMELVAAT
jgi:hypothetical protein